MAGFYTAQEAIRRLKMPRSTFYALVHQGHIPHITLPLRKQAMYDAFVIDNLAREEASLRSRQRRAGTHFSFGIATQEDLDALNDDPFTGSGRLQRAGIVWVHLAGEPRINSEALLVLKDEERSLVVAGIALSPLQDRAYCGLLACEQCSEAMSLPAPHAQDYVPLSQCEGQIIDLYICDIFTRTSLHRKQIAAILLRHVLRYFEELLERGIVIRTIYCYLEAGLRGTAYDLLRGLGFKPCVSDPCGHRVPNRLRELLRADGVPLELLELYDRQGAFSLRLFGGRSPSRLVRAYQRKQHAVQRRQRRRAKVHIPSEP